MESLGTEVGQKMRCAVKAKLVELGTGSSSGGYIDDELPDYVMIMVANKRSKKQMRDDLQLFLNENTDSFVNWLHQVLDKLQEVTLPPSVTQKVSGKSSKDSSSATTKDKEKKSKKQKRSQKETPPRSSTDKSQPTASITDVFADQLIGKAKRSLETQPQVKKQPKETSTRPSDEFNIPSVTDLVKGAVVNAKRKELEELEQIQKQIEEAKRQLKIIPDEPSKSTENEEPAEEEEDDDEDFLNLKADDFEDEESSSLQSKQQQQTKSVSKTNSPPSTTGDTNSRRRTKSPIIFDNHRQRPRNRSQDESQNAAAKPASGENIISLSAHRQLERELYTPVHRRAQARDQSGGDRERQELRPRRRLSESRDRRKDVGDRNYRRSPVRRERSPRETRRPRERQTVVAAPPPPPQEPKSRASRVEVTSRTVVEQPKADVRQRIGSRVIVAPPKPHFEEEEDVDVPVNSKVTIKPRPVVAKNRQANKNLLLRAMAEAQKSMVGSLRQQQTATVADFPQTLTTTLKVVEVGVKGGIKSRLGTAIGTKRQLNAIVNSLDAVVKRQKPNEKIIIEIGPNDGFSDDDDEEEEDLVEEDDVVMAKEDEDDEVEEKMATEYVPKPVDISSQSKKADLELIVKDNFGAQQAAVMGENKSEGEEANTQFVVTLDGAFKKGANGGGVTGRKRGVVAAEAKKAVLDQIKPPVRTSSRNANVVVAKGLERQNRKQPVVDLRQRVQEKRRDSPRKDQQRSNTPVGGGGGGGSAGLQTRKRRSPISFRARDGERGTKEATTDEKTKVHNDAPQRKRIRIQSSPEKNEPVAEKQTNGEAGKSKIVVVAAAKERRDPKKYDNIPPLLSSVAVPAVGSTIGKVLERCKFFPNCSRGDSCEFVHPTTNCKSFPNCKFGENCLYIHPKCKFDLACVRPDCNYSHTPVSSTAPPLSSHVVPVQNYKSISSNPLPPICRFYPNCTNPLCTFFHPKLCFFGKNCSNKLECNFYHHDTPATKFRWVASAGDAAA